MNKYKQRFKPISERFFDYVNKSDGCWEWIGGKNDLGYGRFRVGYETRQAHRVSWVLHIGKIPRNLFVLHRCDNPSCVNPDHLFLGTAQHNSDDKFQKGRDRVHIGSEKRLSKLHENDIPTIRSMVKITTQARVA